MQTKQNLLLIYTLYTTIKQFSLVIKVPLKERKANESFSMIKSIQINELVKVDHPLGLLFG